jgi:hypothetical protein
MEVATAIWLGVGLFLLILVPYLVFEIRKGKRHGHTWFTWFKPRGHSDIGPQQPESLIDDRPDLAVPYTKPGIDEAQGARR